MIEAVEFEHVPHKNQGNVICVEPAAEPGSSQYLCHVLTGDRCALPISDERWELQFDDEGCAYVENGEVSLRAHGSETLRRDVYVRRGQRFLGCLLTQIFIPFSQWCYDHRMYQCGLRFGVPAAIHLFKVGAFTNASGIRQWWKMADFYSPLGLTTHNRKDYCWASQKCTAWKSMVAHFSLPSHHFREPIGHGAAETERARSQPDADFQKTISGHACSTVLLLLSTCRHCTKCKATSGAQSEAERNSWRLLLNALMARSSPLYDGTRLIIALGELQPYQPPARFGDAPLCELHVLDGKFMKEPFMASIKSQHRLDDQAKSRYQAMLENYDEEVVLADFLVGVAKQTDRFSPGLLQQLCVAISFLLEGVLFEERSAVVHAEEHGQEPPPSNGMGLKPLTCGDKDVDRDWRILRYWWAGRKVCHDSLHHAHLALDKATVGKRRELLMLITVARIGFWAPPQVKQLEKLKKIAKNSSETS